jgi:membrane fusion protein, multidrug efflux system
MDETSPVQSRPRRKHWAVWAAAVLLLCGATYVLSQRSTSSDTGSKSKGKKGAAGPIPVGTAKVGKGNIGVYINALGTVTPVYTVTVASRVAGQLMEVYYREGQIVKKGDLLAVVDPRPYQATVTQAQGQLARDQAILQNARLDLQRYQTAFAQHAIPGQTLNTQQATVAQNEGTVKFDQGNLDAAQVNLDYSRITSPISGRVGLRTVDPGNIIPANGTTGIATITQLQPITVIFPIAEDYIDEVAGQLRKHQTLRVDALDRANETVEGHGTVLTVDNQIDPTTGTVRVRASFPNTDYALFPNEFVNAKLLVKTLMGVNLIPTAAIQRNNEVSFVYVVDPQTNMVHSRNIDVATTEAETAAVTGVAPGELLVTDGFDRLMDGAKVRPQAPAAARPGSRGAGTAAANQATGQAQGTPGRRRQGQATDQPNRQASPAQPGAQR